MSKFIKFGLLVTILTLSTGIMTSFAEDSNTHTIAYDGFSFSYNTDLGQNVNIVHYAGDPVADAVPAFSDAAYTQFLFYNEAPAAEGMFDKGGIRLYRTEDLATYPFMNDVVTELQTLLNDQPDLASYMQISQDALFPLPFLPIATHGQVIRARAEYVQTDAVQGVSYITVYQAAAEPFLSNSFLYTFQGISTDGQYYVSVIFPVTVDAFPAEAPTDFDMMAFQESLPNYYNDSMTTLNSLESDAISSLPLLSELVQSITFNR
jgi:hypothetical protein